MYFIKFSVETVAGPPTVAPDCQSHVALKTRQMTANKIYEQFSRIFQPVNPALATEHTKRQEQQVYNSSTGEVGYKQAAMSVLMKLKKRPIATHADDVGIDGEWSDSAVTQMEKRLAQSAEKFILTEEQLKMMEYPLENVFLHEGGSIQSTVGMAQTCDRCKREFVVKDVLDNADLDLCTYHFGRMRQTMNHGERRRIYTCCNESYGSPGCTKGPHVYKGKQDSRHEPMLTDVLVDKNIATMHDKIPFVKVPGNANLPTRKSIVALDCEMGYTTAGMELLRITAIDDKLNVILDERVLPLHMILDLNTRFSGISTLEGAKYDLDSVRKELFKYIDADTILLGHGLENDMIALRIVHHKIIDTAAVKKRYILTIG
ncbi:RNA exonuclease 3 [Apophysomyces sp. BC1021]|nr:RNA exonuclease 3 [Apophysomyces sp. BC1021]